MRHFSSMIRPFDYHVIKASDAETFSPNANSARNAVLAIRLNMTCNPEKMTKREVSVMDNFSVWYGRCMIEASEGRNISHPFFFYANLTDGFNTLVAFVDDTEWCDGKPHNEYDREIADTKRVAPTMPSDVAWENIPFSFVTLPK